MVRPRSNESGRAVRGRWKGFRLVDGWVGVFPVIPQLIFHLLLKSMTDMGYYNILDYSNFTPLVGAVVFL